MIQKIKAVKKQTTKKEFWNDIKYLKKYRLIAIVAVDEIEFFTVIYNFEREKEVFQLRIKVNKTKPILQSIHTIYPSAIYYECEIHDFFGIEFEGNHRQHDKLFLPDDFKDKPPLLK